MKLSHWVLKVLRKLYTKIYGKPEFYSSSDSETNADKVSEIIYNILEKKEPCMIARFGANELNITLNYLNVKRQNKNILDYITCRIDQWWWNRRIINNMSNNAGFFPANEHMLAKFSKLMLNDMSSVDVLGSWLSGEKLIEERIGKIKKVKLIFLEPYTSNLPWSRILEGKKVLVVHPFAELIKKQYEKRELLFKDSRVLPKFDLKVIPAVQSLGGESCGFVDWFEALQWMKDEIDKKEYDICLIGAGAYGFPLAAHVKHQGKKSVHLGGALQILFGIKGSRWENQYYSKIWGLDDSFYLNLLNNNNWVRPPKKYKPNNANKVEGATYW